MVGDSSLALTGLLGPEANERQPMRLTLDAGAAGSPIYYYLTVSEVPKTRPVNPEDQGIQVERWYERYDDGKPVVSVHEGDLVRVRLRLKVPTDRTPSVRQRTGARP